MISQNEDKLIRSLHQKKFRNKHEKFIVEGARSIDYALNNNGSFSIILYTKGFSNKFPNLIKKIQSLDCSLIIWW